MSTTIYGAPDIASIRARLAAATHGPWEKLPTHDGGSRIFCAAEGRDNRRAVAGWGHVVREADADLIVHAPTDLAALCDEVERLRALRPETTAAVIAHMNRADAAEAAIARVREVVASLESLTAGEDGAGLQTWPEAHRDAYLIAIEEAQGVLLRALDGEVSE